MGDRDGADERANEEPTESDANDSADDDQQVPSSTAADAKADDDGGDDDVPADDGKRRRSPDEAATSDTAGADDADADTNAGDAGDGDARQRADDASAGAPDADESTGVDTDSVDAEDSAWTPPTSDDVDDRFDRDEESVADDDPTEWWENDPADDGVDEDETDETTIDDHTPDDEDLSPAARRDQMENGGGQRDPDGDDDDNTFSGTHVKESSPKGGSRAPKGGSSAGTTSRPTSEYDSDMAPATAPDDEEMPLTEHVEEMALRFLAVGLVMFGVAGIVVFYANDLINFLWYSFLGDAAACPGPNCDVKPRVYHPLSLVLARLKVSTLVGLIIALPVGVYQTYRFMRPGLYPRERRYYLAAVPTSVILAAVGVGFAYFAVLPSLFAYFTEYSEQAATTAFGLTETFNLIVLMLGFFALVFQIPLLVMLAIMMGVTTRQWLEDRRLYFWAGFAGVAFLFSPDPTGMAPLIVAVTMIVLFEGTLTLLRWTGTGSPIPTADEAADERLKAYAVAALGGYIASSGPIPPGYYDALPAQVTELLANSGGPVATPAIIAGVLIGLFEIGTFLLRRFGHSRRALKARLAVSDARIPVWLGAVVVGYFGSPRPTLITAAENLALPPTQAVLVGVGLVVLYELFVAVLRWREGRTEAPEESPTEDV